MGRIIDLTGQIFGRLTVLSLADKTDVKTKWNCVCVCGNHTIVRTGALRGNKIKSCGCLWLESIKTTAIKNAVSMEGKTFGCLTVLKRAGTNKDRHALWQCQCSCGRTKVIPGIWIRSGHSTSCGHLSRGSQTHGVIYGIYDNNGVVRYVGQTIKYNIEHRLEEHLQDPVSKKMREWLNSINYKPEIKCIMKNVPLEVLNYAEKKAIKFFHKKHELNNTNNLL